MKRLRVPSHDVVGDKIADIEPGRPNPCEFTVDDARVVLCCQDRARVQITMYERLRLGQIGNPSARDRSLQVDIVTQCSGPGHKTLAYHVAKRARIRIDEDEIDRNALQSDIA